MECNITYLPTFLQRLAVELNGVNAIIFDLGGVIINLDTSRTFDRLQNMASNVNKSTELENLYNKGFFNEYERGNISDPEFRKELSKVFQFNEDQLHEIDEAWNAMLLDIPSSRIDLVKRLKAGYEVYVLSNTNQIHIDKFNKILFNSVGETDLDHIFHKAYYSHRTGYRKPEKEIYQLVLDQHELHSGSTLFVDDNPHNIEAAQSLSLKTLHIPEGDDILNHL
ncbi:MAG: HAD family phosphatase [Bacteroidota bacterium]